MHVLATLLAAAAFAAFAQAQESTISLSPIGFEDDGLEGEAVGTGADGTTFVLSGTFASLSIPFTMTLVEDATHVSITADIATAGTTVNVGAQCGINGGSEACTEVLADSALSETKTLVFTGTAAFTGVPVVSGSASSGVSSASVTQTPASTSASSGAAQVMKAPLALRPFGLSVLVVSAAVLPAILHAL